MVEGAVEHWQERRYLLVKANIEKRGRKQIGGTAGILVPVTFFVTGTFLFVTKWLILCRLCKVEAAMTFQEIILNLQKFWSDQGCIVQNPYDIEKGAGTMNLLHSYTLLVLNHGLYVM